MPSKRSLLAEEEYRGLRVPLIAGFVDDEEKWLEMSEPSQSTTQTATLRTITTAIIARNRERQMPNRSCGLSPTAYANDSIPVLAFEGNKNRKFAAVELMKIGEFGSLSWSTKLDGGL